MCTSTHDFGFSQRKAEDELLIERLFFFTEDTPESTFVCTNLVFYVVFVYVRVHYTCPAFLFPRLALYRNRHVCLDLNVDSVDMSLVSATVCVLINKWANVLKTISSTLHVY